MRPLITVVIPTKNSAVYLANCLQSIKQQDYADYEVIVVDALSTDGTIDIARRFGARVLSASSSPPAARNAGFSHAKGTIFVSIDSDMLLAPGLFSEIAMLIGKYDALIIPEIGYGTDFLSRCKDLEKRCYIGDEHIESARAFSKAAFNSVGGYDPALHFGEDWDLHARLKSKFAVGRTNKRIMHDTRHLSLAHDLKKAYRYGKSLPRYLAKRHPQTSQWLNPKNFFFFRHFRKLVKQPPEALGLLVIKSMEYAAGIAGFIIGSLAGNEVRKA